jgi:hypothetical protein
MIPKTILKNILFGFFTFLGLSILGFFIFKGLKTFSDKDRVITVKGLAEIDMLALESEITLQFSFSGDQFNELIQKTESKKLAIIEHLIKAGVDKNQISTHKQNVSDREKYYETRWRDGREVEIKIDRYKITQKLSFLNPNIENNEDLAAQLKLDLIRNNLPCTISTNYAFPPLNSIKPQLIAESTKNARIAGEQFANDSQAKLGKIKTASQGQISIVGKYYYEDYDNYSEDDNSQTQKPYVQKARVVSTIVFFLE